MSLPPCRVVTILAIRGNRTRSFASSFLKALNDERKGLGPGPSHLDSILFAGHVAVSLDDGMTAFGFHPDGGTMPVSMVLEQLKNGTAFPGIVRDDSSVFLSARSRGQALQKFDVIVPDPEFLTFQANLDAERANSQYSYGFPNGDGDCNCVTWLERLGIPLLTGRMNEFFGLSGLVSNPMRRFGRCT